MNIVNIITLPFELRVHILCFVGTKFNEFSNSMFGGNDLLNNYKYHILNRLSEYNTVTKFTTEGNKSIKMKLPDGRLHHTHKPSVVIFNDKNIIIRQRWHILGKYNRYCKDKNVSSLPSTIGYYDDGNIKSEFWFVNDIPHRIGYPAYIEYSEKDCGVKQEMWYAEGKLDRIVYDNDNKSIIRDVGKPTIITYDKDVIVGEEYYVQGKLHRENDLPAKRRINNEGTLVLKWVIHGMIYRDNYLPAVIQYKKNGNIQKQWYENGKLHRSRISTCNEHDTSLLIRTKNLHVTQHGKLHSQNNIIDNNLAADISYDKHNNVIREAWFHYGVLLYSIEYN